MAKEAFLSIPVLIVFAIVIGDVVSFNQWAALHFSTAPFGMTILFLIFHWLAIMLVWSYLCCLFVSSFARDHVPSRKYFQQLHEWFPQDPVATCSKCRPNVDGTQPFKHLRTHHCSICGECVLKMDHHCPWIKNCVGAYSFKAFVLFLTYTCVGCLLYSATAGYSNIMRLFDKSENKKLDSASGFSDITISLITLSFGVVMIFFAGFHWNLVLNGRTTLELMLRIELDQSVSTNSMSMVRS